MTKPQLSYILIFILFLIAATASAQVTFTDVTEAAGLLGSLPAVSARSTTWGDYDNDGDLDLFITVRGSALFNPDPDDQGIDMLYRNEGGGVFIDVAQQAGVHRHANHLIPNGRVAPGLPSFGISTRRIRPGRYAIRFILPMRALRFSSRSTA